MAKFTVDSCDVSANLERRIITAMILSKGFLKNISPIFMAGIPKFDTRHTQMVAEWCWNFYLKYNKPPKDEIHSIFKSKKKTEEDERNIGMFLQSISDEYVKGRKLNINYITDLAENYFKKANLKILKGKIQKCLTDDDAEGAEDLINKFASKMATREVKWTDPFSKESIRKTFAQDEGEEVLTLPGHYGKIMGGLQREYLIAFLGKSGTGKTWSMVECAILGALQGNYVLYINLEMSEKQMNKRFYQRLTMCPSVKVERLLIPVFDCKLNQTNECTKKIRLCNRGINYDENKENSFDATSRKYIPCHACLKYKKKTDYQVTTWFKEQKKKAINVSKIWKRVKNLLDFNHFGGGKLRLATYPAGAITLKTIESEIDRMVCLEGFLPDIIITDYADKFTDKKQGEYRHNIQQIWTAHKALAQKYHCLGITGSQSSAMRSDEDTKFYDWAEGICKINEIDIGIIQNQTPEEKKEGIMRYSIGKHRHRHYNTMDEVVVLYNFHVGRPYLDSFLTY